MNEIACPNNTISNNNNNNNRSAGLINNNECDPDAIMIKLISGSNNSGNNNNGAKRFHKRKHENRAANAKSLYAFHHRRHSNSKVSSSTSSCSDISEVDADDDDEKISTLLGDAVISQPQQENAPNENQLQLEEDPQVSSDSSNLRKTARSMSEGHANSVAAEPFEVFPSLPDSVLEKLGLLGDQSKKERLNEDDLEHKFVSLSLAFTIDAATIQSRADRQRRYRDQTEANLTAELDRLVGKVHKLQPLCVDADTTELLASLLAQVDVIVRAVDHAATAAERFGAVQHEERLADSVQLMISHVNVLKKQRDSTRRQLQYTKRVLQDTHESTGKHRTSLGHINATKILTRRRASIATIGQSQLQQQEIKFLAGPNASVDPRRISRRTSDLSLRSSVLARMPRPLRLELGYDLVKINEDVAHVSPEAAEEEDFEGETSSFSCHSSHEDSQDESANFKSSQVVLSNNNVEESSVPLGKINLRKRLLNRLNKIYYLLDKKFAEWLAQTGSEFFNLCALLCFFLGLILLFNTLVELELEKRRFPATF